MAQPAQFCLPDIKKKLSEGAPAKITYLACILFPTLLWQRESCF